MGEYFGLILFVLIFFVLPALEKRGRARRRRERAAESPEERPRTTFEEAQTEASAPRGPAELERERRQEAEVEVDEVEEVEVLGDLWGEIERMSRRDPPAPAPVPAPAPTPPPRAPQRTSRPEPVARTERAAPVPRPERATPGTLIDSVRRPVPPARKVERRKHLHRRGIGQARGRPPLIGREALSGIELRRAVLYRELLGPPVSLREGLAPTDDWG